MKNTKPHTILVVDDDQKLVDYICEYLERYEFATTKAYDGLEGIELILEQQPDAVVLDLMMPGTDGVNVCRQVRPQYNGHILMLTGIDDDLDQVAAIEVGVDDYVVKPVQLRVLLARIRMLLRRGRAITDNPISESTKADSDIQFGELRVCKRERNAYLAGQSLNLTSSEFDLLWLLAHHPEDILSREMLLKSLRGIEYDGIDRSIDTRIVGLRKKLSDSRAKPFRIITVRGKGYMFAPDAWGNE